MLKSGDYVLATKYADGCPHDQWCVGLYFAEKPDGRHEVVDNGGHQFRIGGFRRVAKISRECGDAILDNMKLIQAGERSLWSWKKFYKRDLAKLAKEQTK